MMEFAVGASVEAVDQLGIWSKAKVTSASENSVVVTFPPWRSEWDREIKQKTSKGTVNDKRKGTRNSQSNTLILFSSCLRMSTFNSVNRLRKTGRLPTASNRSTECFYK